MSPMTAANSDRLRCPYCRARRNRSIDSYRLTSLPEIRRRRECLACHRRYTTRERLADVVDRVAAPPAEPSCAKCFELEAKLDGIARALGATR